ncbi:hypothetical protein Droror1_Dr00008576 [Drosera rotundifolia]
MKGLEAPARPSTVLVTPTAADAVRTITSELSREEWDIIQKIRSRRADPPVRELSEDSEDLSSDSKTYAVRCPQGDEPISIPVSMELLDTRLLVPSLVGGQVELSSVCRNYNVSCKLRLLRPKLRELHDKHFLDVLPSVEKAAEELIGLQQ